MQICISKKVSRMEIPNEVIDEFWKFIAAIVALVGGMVIAYVRKVPQRIVIWLAVYKNIDVIGRFGKVNDIMDTIAETSGAMYHHILLYKNGADAEKDEKNTMSIKWESIGKDFLGIRRIKSEWNGVEISQRWLEVMKSTLRVQKDDVINTVCYKELDPISQSIWNSLGVYLYKEIHIKSFGDHFHFMLGLSFNKEYEDTGAVDGLLKLAAMQLKHEL